MHVLITGARAPACLEWARAFKATGWTVTVADSLSFPLSRFSCAAHHYRRLPPPRFAFQAWSQALQNIVRQDGVDWVLPTCEEAFYLARIAHELPCPVAVSPFELMHRLHHKGHFAAMTSGWPISAPASFCLHSSAELRAFLAGQDLRVQPDGRLDWVFKPAYSRFATRTLIRPRPDEVSRLLPRPESPWVAQQHVQGRELCSYSLFHQGRLTAHACYHPRHRVGQGSGIWFEPVDPPLICEFLAHFGAATGYHGQVGFDFIESPDGHLHVLECNPRATSGLHLLGHAPVPLVHALMGAPGVAPASPTPRMVGLAMRLFAVWRKGLHPGFWQDVHRAEDVIVRKGDWGPLAAQVPALAEICWRAVSQRKGLLTASTQDIEWDGQPL